MSRVALRGIATLWCIILSVNLLPAQSLSNPTMGFAGGHLKSESGFSFTFSAGEAITGTFQNDAVSFQSTTAASSGIPTYIFQSDISLPTSFALSPNYPNPFNPTTNIRFELPQSAEIQLVIHNSIGAVVTRIHMGNLTAGVHIRTLNMSSFASGMYLYSLYADGAPILTRKMTLLK